MSEQTQTITKPVTPPVVFPTPDKQEDIEQYLLCIGRSYVKLGKDGKPDPAEKGFFYKVGNMIPQYFGLGNEADVKMIFHLEKYDRDPKKMVSKKTDSGAEIKEYARVTKHTWDGLRWVVNDPFSDTIRCEDFEKQYAPE